ncbi:MAG: exodeoxyribonuclease VII small subunit [Candidatus Saccharimonadales bacterium]
MAQAIDYRKLNKQLEVIIDKLQSDELDVDQTIDEYQKGVVIIEQLEKYLQAAQNKITKINQKTKAL